MRAISKEGRESNRNKRLLSSQIGNARNVLVELASGEIRTVPLHLDALFDLKPGEYSVSLLRDVSADKQPVQLAATVHIVIPGKPMNRLAKHRWLLALAAALPIR